MRDPEALIDDIVAYSRRALDYTKGVDETAFLAQTGIQDQVIRCLEVVGEAARRMPEDVRSSYPGVPWAQMAGMRNHLSHEYGAVDMRAVWLTVVRDLPAILKLLESG